MEILAFIGAVVVVWFVCSFVRNRMQIRNLIRQQTRDYLRTYFRLRDVTMTYASRGVLYEETIRQVLTRQLPSAYNVPQLTRRIVQVIINDNNLALRDKDRFAGLVAYAIFKTICHRRGWGNNDQRELEMFHHMYGRIFQMVSEIFPESI